LGAASPESIAAKLEEARPGGALRGVGVGVGVGAGVGAGIVGGRAARAVAKAASILGAAAVKVALLAALVVARARSAVCRITAAGGGVVDNLDIAPGDLGLGQRMRRALSGTSELQLHVLPGWRRRAEGGGTCEDGDNGGEVHFGG